MTPCVIYKRTSSLTNSGDDKDSSQRQEQLCFDYCYNHDLQVAATFYDEGVSGKISFLKRKGFKQMYLYCLENDVSTIVFESISRLSRDSFELESGYRRLKVDGFTLISVTDGGFEDNRISKLNRQILSAIAEYQREEIVFNLSVSRERKKTQNKERNYVTLKGEGKCEGRKSKKELQPELVRLVKKLRKRNWKTKRRRSLRKISQHLFELGYVNERGNPYSAQSISDMVKQ
jgi:DNA invertase Pin-like site-specific DNA recombinase